MAKGDPFFLELDGIISMATDFTLSVCEKAYQAGVSAALTDALLLCSRDEIDPPRWVVKAAAEERIHPPNRGAGRRGWLQDMIHYDRWRTVREIRSRQRSISDPWEVDPADYVDYGTTWPEALNAASEYLRSTPAQGDHSAIKKSFELVVRAKRAGRGDRFYQPLFNETAEAHGLQREGMPDRWHRSIGYLHPHKPPGNKSR